MSVTIPLADTFGCDGTIDLGTPSITVPLGDVSLPGLQSLSLDLPSLTVENLAAVVGPIRDLRLGALVAQNIRSRGVVAPVSDFQLLGLGLGRVALEGLSVPAAGAADADRRAEDQRRAVERDHWGRFG